MFEMLLLIGGPLLGSVAVGFATNRFVLGQMTPGRKKAIALAVSRAVFYAPTFVHIGHGLYIPAPLLLTIAYSFREFGPDLDVLVFLIPTVVLFSSLAAAWLRPDGAMPVRTNPVKLPRFVGIAIAIQGAFFVGVSLVALPTALRVAEILAAEDFDRPGGAPPWFDPWLVATLHPMVPTVVFLALGAVLAITGLLCARAAPSNDRWLARTLSPAMICISILAVALTLLSTAGVGWSSDTPAYAFRRALIASTVAVWLESSLLLATMAIVRRARR